MRKRKKIQVGTSNARGFSANDKKSIMDLAGAWADRPELDGIFKEILKRKSRRKPVTF